MKRIKILIEHIIESAKLQGNEDLEICARTLLGSIERECLDDLAESCIEFTQDKVVQRMMEEN